ncbi:lipoprotein insertase outer membrane protein LolB [Blochmannia endosymbiont of Camponotus sp.]|uniref:lipoprotein insertase outer membrane protein LolB n=1 Tax=Blochmannia endosymbiont of Camponotus sp. TaxID=700220 RepID=UPI002024C084|nr:lipoprotein insertase outer membrane protein LolB [Blochmannia endosymbiont of Camponotus sp.]URJ30038.1 lipoprotein insertase outer membrane protein LolB [Blochmannia endosymbiont of Camponotus sp.]
MYRHICFRLFGTAIFICVSCVHHQNFSLHEDKLVAYMWNNHKALISNILNYQAQGAIIYMINNQRKVYVPFIWTQDNDNCHIKLFNVFGLTVISISVENGVVSIWNNISRKNDDLKNEVQKWFMMDVSYFLEQLQQWIIGLPNSDAEYNLNSIGCLSHINYYYNNKNISIYYRHYYANSIPILPKVLDIYYDQYSVRLIINNWNIQ